MLLWRVMRAYLKQCLVLILLTLVFGSACRKSDKPESVSSSRSTVASSFGPGFMLSNAPVLVGHAIKLSDLSESEIRFGIAPKRGPGVTYTRYLTRGQDMRSGTLWVRVY